MIHKSLYKLGKDAVENGPIASRSTVEFSDMKLVWLVLSRRTITSEDNVSAVLTSITGKYRTGLSTDALSILENREKEELEELSKSAYLQVDTSLSLPGRLSGSVEWRRARSELGQADSLSCSSCPVRKCVDAHAELGTDGHRFVTVDGNPIHSSLALPVALDAVDEMLSNYKNNIMCTKGSQFPRHNRLCSGSILASREQLPIGIATAAFDGVYSSKWEEPNGAKDGQTCELESYDLMSANDAPERDPMDWVLEGSADGGSIWVTIDARSSELFESRFCRKSFSVDKRYEANAFRFRFLRSRESNSNPRFQIGSIDLYGQTQL
ncbi:hypothetical protein PR202_gb20867 [Eleusine coracana subsp. coracana]|uniref:Uncharacterized protein n=1 Tax=Eleusine coracana subsp. coracana TaxID=191504 RepID=A0AAV5FCK1_ELECO|nr:hypothetical protein PR202_gb20867 [Eleusine coracana subsp. coracana]